MKVFVLGSCRVHRPMRKLADLGKVYHLNAVDPCWFLHTARAARQSLEIIQGKVEPPLHLRDLVFETDNDRTIAFRAPEKVQAADVIVVEVCTLNSIALEGWDANAHRVHRASNAADVRLEGGVRSKSTSEDIAREIRAICGMSEKPVVVVNHIALTGLPALDHARKNLTQTLFAAAEITPFTIFDTGTVLRGVLRNEALHDANHYNKAFELTVGEGILATICEWMR